MTDNRSAQKNLLWLSVLAILFLSGCGNRFEQPLRDSHQVVQTNLTLLKKRLDSKQLTNALLIGKYVDSLVRLKPEYADIASLMKKESGSQGKAFAALERRLSAVNLSPTNADMANYNLQELQLINKAADVFEYNNSLADVANTLASLSDGELPVIDVPASLQATAQQANALVGNPSYGNWKQDSSGRSFWEWYGMYSLFSNVMGGRSYYNNWASRPNYSYYGNYGRNRWGSDTDVSRNYDLSRRNPGKYNKPSSATRARYTQTSNRSSSYGGTKSSNKTKSSSYGSSSRSSSYARSRSSRSGK